MEGPEIKAVEAVIDNGSFGKRTLRFETGRRVRCSRTPCATKCRSSRPCSP